TVGLFLNILCSFRDLEDLIDIVDGFPWVSTVKTLVDAIPSLKRVKLTLMHPSHTQAEGLNWHLQAIAKNISDAFEATVEIVLDGHALARQPRPGWLT
ncbi:hypothetical protein H0H92_002539, partial [Tricholoma furcatifolium]